MSLRVYFGYHRSGSTWLCRILEQASATLGLRFGIVHDARLVGDLGAHVRNERLDVLAFTNTDPAAIATLPPFRGIRVVRDPRDVIVSAYFAHLRSHPTEGLPWLVEHRAQLQELGRDDGLMDEIRCRGLQFEQMLGWTERADVTELCFEDLISQPGAVVEALQSLDLVGRSLLRRRLSKEDAAALVHRNRFQLLAGGRLAGTEDVAHHYRRGLPGDWRNHLTPAHIARIEATWPELLPRYAHE